MKYIIKRTAKSFQPDGNWNKSHWNKSQWSAVESIKLENFMGDKPAHFPDVEAKLTYDDNFLYVIFKVKDRYVKAVNTEYGSPVCTDSCVEFFFTPATDISKGYFNIETNCCGTMLFHHQTARNIGKILIPETDGKKIELFSTFNGKVEPEITEQVEWLIEYKVPYTILEKYAPLAKPKQGTLWRANFYKCADKTSQPHWLTWNKIELPKPDFHRPEFFGMLEFE